MTRVTHIDDVLASVLLNKPLSFLILGISGHSSGKDGNVAGLLNLQAEHQVMGAGRDPCGHRGKVLAVRHVQPTRNGALLTVGLDQGSSLLQGFVHALDHGDEWVNNLDLLQDSNVADHEVDALQQI